MRKVGVTVFWPFSATMAPCSILLQFIHCTELLFTKWFKSQVTRNSLGEGDCDSQRLVGTAGHGTGDVLEDGGINAWQNSHEPLLKPELVVVVCEGGEHRTELPHCSCQHGVLHCHGDIEGDSKRL